MSKNHTFKRIRNSAVIKNPLLFEAIGLCPVVAIATSLRLSIFLAVVTAIEMIVCEVLASLLLKNVRRYWRVMLYAIFGVAVIFPIMILVNRFFPDISINFGIYLPLMAVNSLIALHCERVAVKNNVKDSFIDAASASLSYGAVTILVGFLRELFANGSVADISINMPVKFPALATPFGGLLIIGFLAAGLKAFVMAKYPDKSPDRAFDTSEIRRSLRGSLKELMKDDFDPYGEGANETESAFIRVRKERKLKAEETQFNTKEVTDISETTVQTTTEKPEKIKKEKKKKEKPSKLKKQTETPRREPRTRNENERTYLDDFSDMLTELEEYKSRTDTETEKTDGGDEE
ncbi:MAG: hypothetical protein E7528_01620 [Ruminococcaceae bacterium]|nr:hypothetical protein [Oscillospiraceae bacterium]